MATKMITSKQNALVKFLRSLQDKKNRDEHGLYLCEGVKMAREAILSGMEFYKLICTERGLTLLGEVEVPIETVSEEVFKTLSGEVSPQGVLAVLYKPKKDLQSPNGSCLFLDGVSDPANVGMIVRTAAAAGYNDLYLADCADAFSPKAVRASMSGIFKVNIHAGKREELLEKINIPFAVADMNGQNAFEYIPQGDVCLVIGNEAHGVSQTLREKAKITLSIPMQNQMESLNAAVSASILMYTLKKR